jgi:glutathionylspermidine synthase
MMADWLVDGEPYLAYNGIALDPNDDVVLRRLTRVFASAFTRAAQEVARDVAGLVEMGFPWIAAELVAAETILPPAVGRFDFVRDADGRWWLLEFNADTPSGIREAIAVNRLVGEMLPEAHALRTPSAGLADALAASFLTALDDLPPGSALGLLTSVNELEDLAQMAFTRDLLRDPLGARGIKVVLGDANNLRPARSGVSLCGEPLAALYRYVPFETMLGSAAFALIYDAVKFGRLRLINGLGGLLLQHKGLLGWLWAHRDDATLQAEERHTIARHLPPTWNIDDCPSEERRADLVAKQVFGREGEEVYFGEDVAADAWAMLRERHTYVVQRRIRVGQLQAAVPTSLGPAVMRGYATIGCYAVGGEWAGYYTRLGGKIITSRAKWIATFVEASA